MIPSVVSSSKKKPKEALDNLSWVDNEVLSTRPDWYVSLSQFERYKEPNFLDVVFQSTPDWLVTLSASDIVFEQELSEMSERILLTNPNWLVEFDKPKQTVGNTYTEQVIATGAIWALNMTKQHQHLEYYIETIKATGPVWLLHMDTQYQDEELVTYKDQVRETGAVWHLSMIQQEEY